MPTEIKAENAVTTPPAVIQSAPAQYGHWLEEDSSSGCFLHVDVGKPDVDSTDAWRLAAAICFKVPTVTMEDVLPGNSSGGGLVRIENQGPTAIEGSAEGVVPNMIDSGITDDYPAPVSASQSGKG